MSAAKPLGTPTGKCATAADGFKNNYFTELCSGSEEALYFRLMDFCITLGLRVMKEKRLQMCGCWATYLCLN